MKRELEQYRERKKQLDARIAQEKAQQEEQKKQQEEAKKKQEKESWVQAMLKRVSGQSHGETLKSKD